MEGQDHKERPKRLPQSREQCYLQQRPKEQNDQGRSNEETDDGCDANNKMLL